ncbi:hypothetical protein NDU88_004223 [Pleurodeles waltl]|uniref:Uncharacterized protein n=1 Tax=Pleurodeles waltl TaxID=8319 RepID=A0AAV7T8I7_PLEWA|nr:hypothetical protein NDU88_004223 [Pleurodeles waltl]
MQGLFSENQRIIHPSRLRWASDRQGRPPSTHKICQGPLGLLTVGEKSRVQALRLIPNKQRCRRGGVADGTVQRLHPPELRDTEMGPPHLQASRNCSRSGLAATPAPVVGRDSLSPGRPPHQVPPLQLRAVRLGSSPSRHRLHHRREAPGPKRQRLQRPGKPRPRSEPQALPSPNTRRTSSFVAGPHP